MRMYQGAADFDLKENRKTVRVFLKSPSKESIINIKNEFSNYVLFLTLSKLY